MGAAHFDAVVARCEKMFADVRRKTVDGDGVTRAAYSAQETAALDILREAAKECELEISNDLAGNGYFTLPGTNRSLPRLLIGSHLDSVPVGGNYDGLAGIIAGLGCLSLLRDRKPVWDVSVMAIRGEENAWFGAQHIGSRAALGLLDLKQLDVAKRVDSGRSLSEHMSDVGIDVARLKAGPVGLSRKNIRSYIEVHIEQGPVLFDKGLPVGIVTGIRGNVRWPLAACHGELGHAGTVPRGLRRDAVVAVADLVSEMQAAWRRLEEAGNDLVMTFGRFSTDPKTHSVTTIPGRVEFSFEARSHSTEVLGKVEKIFLATATANEEKHRIRFDLGQRTQSAPVDMDMRLKERLKAQCQELGIDPYAIASGAGHDAQDFASAGIPSAMIFLRNEHGSHNAREHMAMEDFAIGLRLLAGLVRSESE